VREMPRTLWCYVCVTGLLLNISFAGQSSLDSPRVKLQIPSTVAPCDTIRIAHRIGLEADLPMGIESAPEPTADECTDDTPQRLLPGPSLSARVALDQLVAGAPHYGWRDMNGVIVVRPSAAWSDVSHFLASPVAAFSATDTDMAQALAAISQPLGDRVLGPHYRGWAASRKHARSFAIRFEGGTLLDALNAVVRPRGDLGWTVSYCGGRAALDTATVALWMYEPDQRRVRAVLSSDPRRPGSPCR
jgi:hypothetical protein